VLEVLPLAVQYGMPLDEFWYGDMRLLSAYQKAHIRNQSYNAWLQGQYNYAGYSICLANAFAKKGTKKEEYPQWVDPMAKYEKPKVTKETAEREFRKQQAEQNAWLFHR
jgi:hypothetical protein